MKNDGVCPSLNTAAVIQKGTSAHRRVGLDSTAPSGYIPESSVMPIQEYAINSEYQERLTEQSLLERLQEEVSLFLPLTLVPAKPNGVSASRQIDALLDVCWEGASARFVVEAKARTALKYFEEACDQARRLAQETGHSPMVVLPFLSETRLQRLLEENISGLDLCGNGVVVVSPRLFFYRTGHLNKFSETTALRNPYRGDSSQVARAFLPHSVYETVNDVVEEILRRGGHITQPTVSKALRVLTDDLVVSREQGRIAALQPSLLLDNLLAAYKPPQIRRRKTVKVQLDPVTLAKSVQEQATRTGVRIARTGEASVSRYAVMARDARLEIYCTNVDRILESLPAKPDSLFPNLVLLETADNLAYFDLTPDEFVPFSSALQCYLELMQGGDRERQTAQDVRLRLL